MQTRDGSTRRIPTRTPEFRGGGIAKMTPLLLKLWRLALLISMQQGCPGPAFVGEGRHDSDRFFTSR